MVRKGDIVAGKYRIDRLIGQGGMGKVFAATHLQLDQQVAIKVLLRDSGEIVDRFRSEARRAARFRGEHVVRVLDVGDLPTGTPYIVMELLEGRDLADLLKERGRLHPSEAVQYLLQACLGLAEVHASGVVHRDLKPQNLFLTQAIDQSTVLKILDFGVAKELLLTLETGSGEPITRTNSMLGSPQYMSPEQVRSARSVGIATDIWALGVVLYQLVTGKLPFNSPSMVDLLTEISEHAPKRPRSLVPELPADLEDTILACLEKDPARRPHVAALAAALAPHGPPLSPLMAERVARAFDAGPRASLLSIPAEAPAQTRAPAVAIPRALLRPELGEAASDAADGVRTMAVSEATVDQGATVVREPAGLPSSEPPTTRRDESLAKRMERLAAEPEPPAGAPFIEVTPTERSPEVAPSDPPRAPSPEEAAPASPPRGSVSAEVQPAQAVRRRAWSHQQVRGAAVVAVLALLAAGAVALLSGHGCAAG